MSILWKPRPKSADGRGLDAVSLLFGVASYHERNSIRRSSVSRYLQGFVVVTIFTRFKRQIFSLFHFQDFEGLYSTSVTCTVLSFLRSAQITYQIYLVSLCVGSARNMLKLQYIPNIDLFSSYVHYMYHVRVPNLRQNRERTFRENNR